MVLFTAFIFIITSLVIYVWIKKSNRIDFLSDKGDLNEPLNPEIKYTKNIMIRVPKMFQSFLYNDTCTKNATDTYLPKLFDDNIIEKSHETSPVPYKFTSTRDPGFFVYSDKHTQSNVFKIEEKNINNSVYDSNMGDTIYYTPKNSTNEEYYGDNMV